jgi:hypothetical protein
LGFFTFSTTQEYYSLPCYPALALLIGSALAKNGEWVGAGTRLAAAVATAALLITGGLLYLVRDLPVPGDIASALSQNPELYTLSLGHMLDLTLPAFAYLRLPLAIAAGAFVIGAAGAWRWKGNPAFLSLAAMMIVFFHAARLALVRFDPYLGSRALAEALLQAPKGELIVDDQYYAFSSIFFYANRRGLLLNGRVMNLEYGSYAPGAPNVFIDDSELKKIWRVDGRRYLVAAMPAVPRLEKLLGKTALRLVASSGGKFLFTNQ